MATRIDSEVLDFLHSDFALSLRSSGRLWCLLNAAMIAIISWVVGIDYRLRVSKFHFGVVLCFSIFLLKEIGCA